MNNNYYGTPEEIAAYISRHAEKEIGAQQVKRIALDGKLLNENGEVGLYELIAYMATVVNGK